MSYPPGVRFQTTCTKCGNEFNFDRAALNAWLDRLDNLYIEQLKTMLDLSSSLESAKSPCGHLARYAYTKDGGKHIDCLLCMMEHFGKEVPRLRDVVGAGIGPYEDMAELSKLVEGYADEKA